MSNLKTVYLVVDDFEVMRQVTAGQLRTLGVETVLTATNGIDALRILRREHVDLVMSDLSMPVMSGLELLKAIRSDERLCRLPFIMKLPLKNDRKLIQEVINAGANDLLFKPYTPQRLATHIQKVMALQKLRANQFQAQAVLKAQSANRTAAPTMSFGAALHKDLRPSVLIVDDEAVNRHLMSQLFNDDYRVITVSNGEEALSICSSDTPPDLVLLDVMMPSMDGFEVAHRMRDDPGSVNIPIIFVTAMTDDEAQLKGMSLGAVDFVSKPINPLRLQLRVGNFMRYVALNKQLQTAYDGVLELALMRDAVDQITRHDLRGPLAGVLGLVQAMSGDDDPDIKPTAQLRLVEDAMLKILDMMNLSAEIFKIETGRFKLNAKPVQIGDILQRIVQMASVTFAEKNLVLQANTEAQDGKQAVQVLGDALLCFSLFQNLIKNACEAAPIQSLVVVSLSDTHPLRILVKNSGVVPTDIRHSFFEKYSTRKKSGTGLGTYSAKLLAEAQGGQIELDVSDEDNTTSLWVTLPRVPS